MIEQGDKKILFFDTCEKKNLVGDNELKRKNVNYLGQHLKRDLFNQNGVFIAPAMTYLNEEKIRLIDLHDITLSESDFMQAKGESGIQAEVDVGTSIMKKMFEQIRYTKKSH